MRILFNTIRSDDLVNLNVVYWLEQEVSKLAECEWCGSGWENHVPNEPINDTVKRIYGNDPPDFIVSNRPSYQEYKLLAETRTEKTPPTVMTLVDNHVDPAKWVDIANRGFNGTLMRYMYSPYIRKSIFSRFVYYSKFDPEFYIKNIDTKKLHFPWFTDQRIYKPIEEKQYDVIFLGTSRKKVYPLRHKIVNELPRICKKRGWRYLIGDRPPGETVSRNISDLIQQGYIVGEKYAEVVAKSKIFIFGSSIFNYPLSKYFEIMGSGTLAMADRPQSAEELHFEAGENYVEVNQDNWKGKLEYYLEDDAERERIARNGYETVMKHHTSEIRARQLLDFLSRLES